MAEFKNIKNRHLRRAAEYMTSSSRISALLVRLFTYVFLIAMAFIFLFPFLYMIITSLKTNSDLYDLTVNWIPRTLQWENYVVAVKSLKIDLKPGGYMWNSVILTVFPTIGHIISCSLIGYGFARFEFPGKKFLFFIVILAFIVPTQTIIVPLYILFSNLGWLNSFLPMIVPTFFGYGLKGALFIYIFRQFYMGLPKDLENAARIDGCGLFKTYLHIVLPVSSSSFMVTLVLSMVWHWNDFYEPAIYNTKSNLRVVPSLLKTLVNLVNNPNEDAFAGLEGTDIAINNAVLMAGTFVVVLPIIIVFAFLQRRFIEGIEKTGITGE